MDVLFVCNYLNVVYDAERSIIDVLLEYKCTPWSFKTVYDP